MVKKVFALLLVLAMVLGLAACGGGTTPANNGNTTPANNSGNDVAPAGPQDTLIIAIETEGNDFDPQNSGVLFSSSSVIRNVYEPLVRNDAEGNIIPALAKDWKFDDDKNGITFYLREGVKFHNGETFTADDVIFSWQERFASSATGSKEALFDFVNMEKRGDYEIYLPFKKQASDCLHDLTQSKYCIMNRKATTEYGDKIGTNPCGTGAYKMVNWVQGDRYELEANNDYWQGKPRLQKITIRIIKEPSQSQIELENGKVDAVLFNTATNDVLRAMNGELKGIQVIPIFNGINALQFNFRKDKVANKLVRQAIAAAIDKDAISKGDSLGLNKPAYQTTIPGYISYIDEYNTTKPNGYDLDKAKEYLKQAGYENGLTLELYSDNGSLANKDGQLLKNMLEKIGITLNLHPNEAGTFVPIVLKGDENDCYLSQAINDYTGSPIQRFRTTVDPSYSPDWDGSGTTGTYSEMYDLLREAETNYDDEAKLAETLKKMNQMETEACYVVPLNTMNIYLSCKEGLHIQYRFVDPFFFNWYFE